MKKYLNYDCLNKYIKWAWLLLYKILLDYIYITIIQNNYNSIEWKFDFSLYKYVLSFISIIVLYSYLEIKLKQFVKFYMEFFFLLMIIPLTTIYSFGKNNYAFFSIIFQFILIIEILSRTKVNKIVGSLFIKINNSMFSKRIKKVIYYFFIINTIIVICACLYYNGLPTLDALNLRNVYSVRNSFYLPKYFLYLYTFQVEFISIYLMITYLHKKRYVNFFIVFLITLLLYLWKGNKSVLFSILISIIIYYLYNIIKNNLNFVFFSSSALTTCLYSITSLPFVLFVRRVLLVPANIKFFYIDFFLSNQKIGIVGTVFNAVLKLNDPYKGMSIANRIGEIYMNNPNTHANAGFLVEGFSRFGIIGLIIIPLLFAFTLLIYANAYNKKDHSYIISVSFISLFYLNDGFFIPSLTFGSILFTVLCFLFSVDDCIKENKLMKNSNKKIVMLLDNCFNPDVRVYKEAKYLVSQGFDVQIIAMDKKNKYKNKQDDLIDGIKVHRIYPRTEKMTFYINKYYLVNKMKMFIYSFWLIKFIIETKKYLRHDDFQYLHCHDLLMCLIGCLFFRKKIVVFDMHEYYISGKSLIKDSIMRIIVNYVQNKCSYIIFVNDFQCKDINEINKSKLVELANYPDANIFNDINKTLSNNIRISYIGAVRDYNSLKLLVDTSNKFKNSIFKFYIHGMGSCYDELMSYAKSLNQTDILTGSYDGINEIEKLYKNTDILYCVYESKNANWENGYPVKLFESIITCTPIIVNKKSTYAKLVEEYNIGFTVDLDDTNSLNELIEYIYNHQDILKQKKENFKSIRLKYTWDAQVSNLLKIYNA